MDDIIDLSYGSVFTVVVTLNDIYAAGFWESFCDKFKIDPFLNRSNLDPHQRVKLSTFGAEKFGVLHHFRYKLANNIFENRQKYGFYIDTEMSTSVGVRNSNSTALILGSQLHRGE